MEKLLFQGFESGLKAIKHRCCIAKFNDDSAMMLGWSRGVVVCEGEMGGALVMGWARLSCVR